MTARLTIATIGLILTADAARAKPPDPAAVEQAVVRRTNAERQKVGARALRVDDKLAKAAREFAGFLARSGKFAHDADGRQPWVRTDAAGYERAFVSENIASEQLPNEPGADKLAAGFLKSWLGSEGHRKNLLDPDVYDLGVGVARAEDGKWYAVQLFGIPKDKAFEFRVVNETPGPVTYTLGGQSFTIEPGVTNTHRVGKPLELAIKQPEGVEAAAVKRTPKAGDKLVIRKGDNGAYKVE
jgi:uncharacterized protein YkwD